MGLLQKYLQGIISNERNELGYKQRVPYQKNGTLLDVRLAAHVSNG